MAPDHLTASDGFVIAMLSMILLSMGVVAMLIICMFRNAARRDPQVDELLEEMEREAAGERATGTDRETAARREPWEKDGDWWKG